MSLEPSSDRSSYLDKPFIAASQSIAEITPQSVVLGLILATVLTVANIYLALYLGITVPASIPATILSLAVLRGILKRGTILENTVVQTMASMGQAMATGILFTIPAWIIAGVWTDIHFWPTLFICLSGGLLGVLFMVPLRKIHIVDDKSLVYPEGSACAEMLTASERGKGGLTALFLATLLGAAWKGLSTGLGLWKSTLEGAWAVGRSSFYLGADISAALLGVGYLIGFGTSAFLFLGGALIWGVAIPYLGFRHGIESDTISWFWNIWKAEGRFIGVGAILVTGIAALLETRSSLIQALRQALAQAPKLSQPIARTELNIERKHLFALFMGAALILLILFSTLLESFTVACLAVITVMGASFVLVAVSSRLVGLVGSSNAPVSGLTICAVLIVAAGISLFGMTGAKAILLTLSIVGVVSCAAFAAGDLSQDLKTGYLVGSTPKKQQWMQLLAILVPALLTAPIMMVLHQAYGIGTGEPGALRAPHAALFAELIKSLFFDNQLPWTRLLSGGAIGLFLVGLEMMVKARGAKFRIPVIAIAVGMYLPITISAPLFVGGLAALAGGAGKTNVTGALFAAGLVAGEALTAVFLGIVIYFHRDWIPSPIFDSTLLAFAALLLLTGTLVLAGRRGKSQASRA